MQDVERFRRKQQIADRTASAVATATLDQAIFSSQRETAHAGTADRVQTRMPMTTASNVSPTGSAQRFELVADQLGAAQADRAYDDERTEWELTMFD